MYLRLPDLPRTMNLNMNCSSNYETGFYHCIEESSEKFLFPILFQSLMLLRSFSGIFLFHTQGIICICVYIYLVQSLFQILLDISFRPFNILSCSLSFLSFLQDRWYITDNYRYLSLISCSRTCFLFSGKRTKYKKAVAIFWSMIMLL